MNSFAINFKQLKEDNEGSWYRGKAGDWEWSIQDMGMSWGICPNLEEAITSAKLEIASILKDFDISDVEIMEIEKDRVNDVFTFPLSDCGF
ncbi:MAG: hypothetical protein CUR32_01195 [Flavobacterium sp.]|nr:MAG: hypothetical protein CUR32_01195 [Flavobacterium sp.] [Flavobacterium sp. FEMGT703F]